jgi:hypothetical protein
MVAVTISATNKALKVARGLPFIVEIPQKTTDDVTIEDIKKSLATKFPKVCAFLF